MGCVGNGQHRIWHCIKHVDQYLTVLVNMFYTMLLISLTNVTHNCICYCCCCLLYSYCRWRYVSTLSNHSQECPNVSIGQYPNKWYCRYLTLMALSDICMRSTQVFEKVLPMDMAMNAIQVQGSMILKIISVLQLKILACHHKVLSQPVGGMLAVYLSWSVRMRIHMCNTRNNVI